MRSLENDLRMKHAYDHVEPIAKWDKKSQGKYKSLAKSFPAMVQNNGLAVAIAFLNTKGEQHHQSLFDELQNQITITPLINYNGKPNDLMKLITTLSREEYRLVSKEVMLYAQWIKRFAEGMLESGETKSE